MINLREFTQEFATIKRRRLAAEAAEVEEVDLWLAKIRSGPELILYTAYPGSAASSAHPVQARPQQRRKKRRK